MKPGNFLEHGTTRFWIRALVIAAFGSAAAAHAATRVVNDTSDDGNTTCNDQTCNLRAAILAAQDDDRIVFSPSLPRPITIHLASPLVIRNKKLHITGDDDVTLDAGADNPGYRVLEITDEADVTIDRLRLVHGRALGPAGAASEAGGRGEGGCVWGGLGSRLILQKVVVRDCQALGGAGGNGNVGSRGATGTTGGAQQNGGTGGTGGTGGAGGQGGGGYGGGIFTDGYLRLISSSIVANTARGGVGGNGGAGGVGGTGGNGGPGGSTGTGGNGGRGGKGGTGGAAGRGGDGVGGGVALGQTGYVHARNTVIADNKAIGNSNGDPGAGGAGGSGGAGGVGRDPGLPGANGSAGSEGRRAQPGNGVAGGFSTNGVLENAGDLEFASVVGNFTAAGSSTATSSGDGLALAAGLGYFSAYIEVRNSIVAANTAMTQPPTTSNCHRTPTLVSGVNLTDTNDCGLAIVSATPGVVYDDSGSRPLVRLSANSPAIDKATDCRLLRTGDALNVEDVRGGARPQDGDGDGKAHCDVGAYEADGIADDRVFRNGFDP
ncbi:MAG: hypothetical protein GXC76_16440 [Rhodanobacteraceae bacterium]|jgi:hypothetical protein|nr:hypothetical protein [Rhodanobacteraceae bacterium]